MFCCNCGVEAGDAVGYCSRCGARLPAVTPATPEFEFAVARRPDIDGWLMLFAIGVTFFAPLRVLADLMKNVNNPGLVTINLALIALSVYTGVLLWTRNPEALKMVRIYLISNAAFLVLRLSGLSQMGAVDSSRMDHTFAIVLRLFSVGCWAWYFHKSRRVLATFGENI